MAEYTGNNFVSRGSSYRLTTTSSPPNATISSNANFPLPNGFNHDGSPHRIVSYPALITDLNGQALAPSQALFVVGRVYDEYTNTLYPETRLASYSLLNKRLSQLPNKTLVLGDNKWVWDDNFSLLIPRAVSFSTGLINHFFRARIGFARSTTGSGWVFSNRSPPGQILDGTFLVYSENAAGERQKVPGASWTLVLQPGQTANVTLAEPPSGTSKLVAVFHGRVGTAEPAVSESGFFTVAGKVIEYTPAPVACGQPISAAGGSSGYQATMVLGSAAGPVQGEFEPYTIPDGLEVRRNNSTGPVLYGTNGLKAGYRAFTFQHAGGQQTSDRQIFVKVTGNSNTSTQWTLTIGCPGQVINNAIRPRPMVNLTIGRYATNGPCNSGHVDYVVGGKSFGRLSLSGPADSITRQVIAGTYVGYSRTTTITSSSIPGFCTGGGYFYTDSTGTRPLAGSSGNIVVQ